MAVRKLYSPEIIDGAEINAIIKDKEFFDKGTMFAYVRLLKGSVVDWHIHNGEIEYYYILAGAGVYTDSDKAETEIKKGDVCTMAPEGGHAIRQTGDEPLEFIALTINTI